MATNNSANIKFTNNADGFDLAGGSTARKITLASGDVSIVGTGSNTYTFPAATGTLVSRDSTDTLTNKTLTSPVMTTPTLGVATATSVNKITITAPASSATLTLANSSSLITSGGNSLTLTTSGTTDATFPSGTITLVGTAATQTLTAKRVTRRLTTTNAPGATPTTNTDNVDVMNFTGLATAITSMTTNLSGTPVDGDLIEFRFTDDGTGRAITWGASFEASTVVPPTTTVAGTMLCVLFEWRAAGSKWRCLATA